MVLLTWTAGAQAQPKPAFTTERATFAGGVRYGSENLNLGLGFRGGYTLSMNLYLGGLFEYWFGESEDFPGGSASASGFDLMFEGGYDFGLTPEFTLRPLGGIGLFKASGEACVTDPFGGGETCTSASNSKAAGSIGGQALYDVGGFNVGGELRLLFADETAALIGANIGAHF
jgi:hypothetical protein